MRRSLLVAAGGLVAAAAKIDGGVCLRDGALPDVLHFMRCLCGRAREGHKRNFNCFVDEQTAPGTYLLDPHGLTCGVCVGVALDSEALVAQGLTRPAIRAAIDVKWAAAGAPTPYPND